MDISKLQTKDIGKYISLYQTTKRSVGKIKEHDSSVSKLNDFVAKSSLKTESIDAQIPLVTLQTDLPISAHAQQIIDLIKSNQVVIVAGETGCGKTTQLPKICLQAGFGRRGLIGHTQPRRVAATSVAKRIADEVNCEIGELIGYSIRFSNKYSDKTRIKLMTDGVLLSEVDIDPLLSRYEVIIIDEAHERSLNIDFLLGFLKQILQKRRDLKVIITSATIDPEKFSNNFNKAPVVLVEGRSYPVEVRYREYDTDSQSNSNDEMYSAVLAAVDECCAESSGDILIFADGEAQIKAITKSLKHSNIVNSEILALYARLSIKDQQKIFASSSKRKIIISTNVAETSLTVPGIVFVIDIGTARISRFSQRNKIQQLPVEKISRASADQRKGRCGRIASGICIRLYSEDDYLARDEFTLPEIKRTNLSSVVLRLKAMKVKEIEKFPFMEPPEQRSWNVAFNSLYELGALDEQRIISKIGELMAKLPVDPQLARLLVDDKLVAAHEMLIICSLMSVREVRERPHDKQQKADLCHQIYNQGDSDILTAISLWTQLDEKRIELSSNNFKKWCQANFINFMGYLEWRRVFYQLKESVISLGVKINESPQGNPDLIHKALIPGFVTHIFKKTPEAHFLGVRGLKVWIHPSSLGFKKSKEWMLSVEMIETEKFYARMNAPIQPDWIEEMTPHLLKSNYKEVHWRAKKGQVMAYLNQSLLGLPVVNQRLINYASVDPELCRTLFLKEGLANDQLNEKFPFILNNRKNLQQLEEQEHKTRLSNIKIDSQSLAELYSSVLPVHIISQISLKRWLKKDFNKHNQMLAFSIEQLTNNQAGTPQQFPSEIVINGFTLNLSYSFSPGSISDGVSVEIPQNMLAQFSERDFDWLVPGYLEEKILGSIKALPKSIRRTLIPVADTAKHCYAELVKIDQTGKRFLDELVKVLQRTSGIQILIEDFDFNQLADHLNMKYKILSKQGAQFQTSLRNEITTTQPTTRAVTQSAKMTSVTDWPIGEFELEKIINKDQLTSRIFQAFKDCDKYVAVGQFSSISIAQKVHWQGVARLILLSNQSQLTKLMNSWPDKQRLERLNLRFGGIKPLFDSIIMRVAKQIVGCDIIIVTQLQFEQISAQFLQQYREMIAQQLNEILPLLSLRESIYKQLSELNASVFVDSIDDIKQQLSLLWDPATIIDIAGSFVDSYSRYHKAIEVRLTRITTNFPKEQLSLDAWDEWHSWWQEIRDNENRLQLQDNYNLLFWMLQDYRVSLFSPGIKPMNAISSKKLQKQFDLIVSELKAI